MQCSSPASLWKTIRKADFIYVFFPGNIPVVSVAMARLLRKPYGVYVRGELGRDSRWWRWSMSGARFVIAHGGILADAARPFCDDVELAIPLCPLLGDDVSAPRPPRREGPWRLLYVGVLQPRKGIPEGFARLSVGLEDANDIVSDLNQALGNGQEQADGRESQHTSHNP